MFPRRPLTREAQERRKAKKLVIYMLTAAAVFYNFRASSDQQEVLESKANDAQEQCFNRIRASLDKRRPDYARVDACTYEVVTLDSRQYIIAYKDNLPDSGDGVHKNVKYNEPYCFKLTAIVVRADNFSNWEKYVIKTRYNSTPIGKNDDFMAKVHGAARSSYIERVFRFFPFMSPVFSGYGSAEDNYCITATSTSRPVPPGKLRPLLFRYDR